MATEINKKSKIYAPMSAAVADQCTKVAIVGAIVGAKYLALSTPNIMAINELTSLTKPLIKPMTNPISMGMIMQ